jgi:hypothetical protein
MMGSSGSYPKGMINSWTMRPRMPIMAARPLLSSMARLESFCEEKEGAIIKVESYCKSTHHLY